MNKIEGAVLLGIVLLVVALGMPVVYFSTFFTSLKKQVKAQNLNPVRLVYTLEFSEESDALEISNAKEKASYQWQDVFHAFYEKEAIYLFITNERAFLLPFEVLESKAEVWKLIVSKVPAERCSKRV